MDENPECQQNKENLNKMEMWRTLRKDQLSALGQKLVF